jgi:sec-independent protein translocase protein TatA
MHFGSPADIFGMDGIIVLIVVVLVLFGSTQIPKLARSLGSAQKEFKKGVHEGASEDADIAKVAAPTGTDVAAQPHGTMAAPKADRPAPGLPV